MDVAILSSMNVIKLFFLSFPGVNPCERSNGECEHLCVYLPSRGSKCLCEENSQLNENGKTCDKLELRGRLSLFLTRVDNRWLKNSSSSERLRMSQASKMALLMVLSLPKEAFDTIDHSLHIRKVHRYIWCWHKYSQICSNGLKHISATVAKNEVKWPFVGCCYSFL